MILHQKDMRKFFHSRHQKCRRHHYCRRHHHCHRHYHYCCRRLRLKIQNNQLIEWESGPKRNRIDQNKKNQQPKDTNYSRNFFPKIWYANNYFQIAKQQTTLIKLHEMDTRQYKFLELFQLTK